MTTMTHPATSSTAWTRTAGHLSTRLTGVARVIGLALLCAGMGGLAGAPAVAQTTTQTTTQATATTNPEAVAPESMRRPPPADLDAVYRGPAIDMLATVRKRGVLEVCVVTVEPMVMRDEKGDLVGYSIDLARRLADDLGVTAEFVPTSWISVIPDLLDRHCDVVITGLWVTAQRALVVNFTAPTATEGIHLVASRAKAGKLQSLDDFNQPGVTIAVYADTAQERVAVRLLPRAQLLRVSSGTDVAAVLEGKAHALLVPTLAPQAIAAASDGKLFLPLAQPLSRTSAAMAVRKGDPDFLSFLNTWLELQREQGWLDERALHWASPAAWSR